MKRILSRGITLLIMFAIMLTLGNVDVYAAEAVSVEVTGGETSVGKEIEVTVSISVANTNEKVQVAEIWIEYDPEVLEAVANDAVTGGGGKVRILSTSGETSYKVKFKGIKAGSSGIGVVRAQTMIGTDTKDTSSEDPNKRMELYTGSNTITVKGAVNQSKNNNLSGLTITPGVLTPAFSKDVTTYNISLSEYVSKLTVSATPEDSKATISVWGAAMDPGDNVTKITVTAENGDQKVYTIYTKIPVQQQVVEKEILIEVDSLMYNVVSNFEEELLPEGYEAVDYTYKNNKIVAGKGISNRKILFCVTDAATQKGAKKFVVYDEQTGTFSPLKLITTNGISYTVVDDDAVLNMITIPEGFVESEFTLDNVKYRVWVDANSPAAQYFIIYCTNFAGDTSWYQYDMVEGTMQRAFLNGFTSTVEQETTEAVTEAVTENPQQSEELANLQAEYDNYVSKTRLALVMMGILLVAVIIVMIVFTIRSFHDSHDGDDEEVQEKPERKHHERHGIIEVSDISDAKNKESEEDDSEDDLKFLS